MRSFEFARKLVGEGYERCPYLNENGEFEKQFPEAKLPEYATLKSAGADFFAAEETIIQAGNKVTLVHTGIKACMEEDVALFLYNRSSNPGKLGLVLANGVGVVDADYYNNPSNDGEIMFAFINTTDQDVVIHVGDKIGQGVFTKFLKPDNANVNNQDRLGGFGSTGA